MTRLIYPIHLREMHTATTPRVSARVHSRRSSMLRMDTVARSKRYRATLASARNSFHRLGATTSFHFCRTAQPARQQQMARPPPGSSCRTPACVTRRRSQRCTSLCILRPMWGRPGLNRLLAGSLSCQPQSGTTSHKPFGYLWQGRSLLVWQAQLALRSCGWGAFNLNRSGSSFSAKATGITRQPCSG